MHEESFQLIVIGTGPAGSRVANRCAHEGWRVAIVEAREFGGTCALRGCNPKKVLALAADLGDWARRADGKLIVGGDAVRVDWSVLRQFKDTFVQSIPKRSRQGYEEAGITTYQGAARFLDPDRIQVGDGPTLRAEHFVIATGARPTPISFPGANHLTHSDAFFDLDKLPPQVLFVGGGYISCEFANVAAQCGSEVTIVEHGPRPLAGFDPDLVDQLVNRFERHGVTVRTSTRILSIEAPSADAMQVRVEGADGVQDVIECDLVVHGAGRSPNLDGLNLEAAGIDADERGVQVDPHLRTTNPRAYACGDCARTGAPPLTPTANQESRTVAQNLLNGDSLRTPDYGAIPSVVFTTPPLASIGLSEAAAREQHDVEVRSEDMSSWSSLRKLCESTAGGKILIDRDSDRILGAHLLGPGADETINLFAVAMKFGLTASDLKSTLIAFPTHSADVRELL